MSQIFWKAGEFARLCGVGKDTLFHYDKIGLLKPEYVGDNGYRYYTSRQLMTFDLISILKEIGTPLKEIKNYLDARDSESFLSVLKDKQARLKEEQMLLQQRQKMLENTIKATETALTAQTGTISISACPCEYLIISRPLPSGEPDEQTYHEILREHIEFCYSHGFTQNFLLGEMVVQEQLLKHQYQESYYFSKIDYRAKTKRLFIKPEGTYATLYHTGSYETLPGTYCSFQEELLKRGRKIIGNAYEEDLLNYLSTRNDNQYLFKISIQIAP